MLSLIRSSICTSTWRTPTARRPRARYLFALADTGILDDLPCADVGADLGHGFSDDVEVEWTYEDFVNVLGAAIAHRTAHRRHRQPQGVAQRQLGSVSPLLQRLRPRATQEQRVQAHAAPVARRVRRRGPAHPAGSPATPRPWSSRGAGGALRPTSASISSSRASRR